jgi:hypothetical protein
MYTIQAATSASLVKKAALAGQDVTSGDTNDEVVASRRLIHLGTAPPLRHEQIRLLWQEEDQVRRVLRRPPPSLLPRLTIKPCGFKPQAGLRTDQPGTPSNTKKIFVSKDGKIIGH